MTSEGHADAGHEFHPATGFLTLLLGIVLVMGVLLGLTAGIGAIWSSVTAPALAAGQAAAGAPAASVVNLVIKDVPTPEGQAPAYVGSGGVGAADLFTATAGTTVKVVVKNEDAMPHSFTAPGLGLDVSINADATTTFTFTPKSAGVYEWSCEVPCGPWVMSHEGYMEGDVKVVA